jgi:hypothetical protein
LSKRNLLSYRTVKIGRDWSDTRNNMAWPLHVSAWKRIHSVAISTGTFLNWSSEFVIEWGNLWVEWRRKISMGRVFGRPANIGNLPHWFTWRSRSIQIVLRRVSFNDQNLTFPFTISTGSGHFGWRTI